MKPAPPLHLKSITAYHTLMGLPKPEHPLISLIRFEDIQRPAGDQPLRLVNNFYSVALKRNFVGKLRYGQQAYDFDEGVLLFIAPGQVLSIDTEAAPGHSGWLLTIDPDFLWNTPLARAIRQYDYFGYSVHEALHLSAKEEALITDCMEHIRQEYHANLDKFSQHLIVARLALLLTYADRFYHRQFITRNITNHQLLARLDAYLSDYFRGDNVPQNGLPTVQSIADALRVTPNYLSALLTMLTGHSTQHHIHDKLIALAKEKLSTTTLSVGEIAYLLGFEHTQSFSRLFKTKTTLTPLAFRQSFN